MKILQLLFISILLIGCNYNSPPAKEVDKRPADLLALIRRFNAADSVYMSESNEIKKTEAIENGKAAIIKFVTDTLHAEVKQWPAVVHEIKIVSYPLNFIDVTLHISKKMGKYEDPSESKIIILHSSILQSDPIKKPLRELLNGDSVLVSGSFKDEFGSIDFLGKDADERDTFSMPEFEFQIKSINKQAKQ